MGLILHRRLTALNPEMKSTDAISTYSKGNQPVLLYPKMGFSSTELSKFTSNYIVSQVKEGNQFFVGSFRKEPPAAPGGHRFGISYMRRLELQNPGTWRKVADSSLYPRF